MRRQGLVPSEFTRAGSFHPRRAGVCGWQVGLCRPGMPTLVLSFGAGYGKLSIHCSSPSPLATAKNQSWSGGEEGEQRQLPGPPRLLSPPAVLETSPRLGTCNRIAEGT